MHTVTVRRVWVAVVALVAAFLVVPVVAQPSYAAAPTAKQLAKRLGCSHFHAVPPSPKDNVRGRSGGTCVLAGRRVFVDDLGTRAKVNKLFGALYISGQRMTIGIGNYWMVLPVGKKTGMTHAQSRAIRHAGGVVYVVKY